MSREVLPVPFPCRRPRLLVALRADGLVEGDHLALPEQGHQLPLGAGQPTLVLRDLEDGVDKDPGVGGLVQGGGRAADHGEEVVDGACGENVFCCC